MKNFFAALLLVLTSVTPAGGSYIRNSVPGVIFAFGGSTCPQQSIAADGTSLLRAGTYAQLYTAIGTTWGSADGTHFNAPDLRDRFLRGTGSSGDGHGGTAVTLGSFQDNLTKLPTTAFTISSSGGHSHDATVGEGAASAGGRIMGTTNTGLNSVPSANWLATDGAHTHTIDGGGDSETRPKSYGVLYCIYY